MAMMQSTINVWMRGRIEGENAGEEMKRDGYELYYMSQRQKTATQLAWEILSGKSP